MKIFVLLLLMSCSNFPMKRGKFVIPFKEKLEDCMLKFADQGYKAESVVIICQSIHKARD